MDSTRLNTGAVGVSEMGGGVVGVSEMGGTRPSQIMPFQHSSDFPICLTNANLLACYGLCLMHAAPTDRQAVL